MSINTRKLLIKTIAIIGFITNKLVGLFHSQAINYRKDGSEFMMEWKIVPIRNEKDEINHYLAIQRNVSES